MASFMVPAAGGTAAVIAGFLVADSGSGFSSPLVLSVVGIIGNVLAIGLIFAPVFSFVIPIVNAKSVGNRTVYGHALMVAGGAAWGLYGIPTWPDTKVSVSINSACFALQLVYVSVYIRYAAGKARWIAVGLLAAALIGSGVLAWAVIVKVMAKGEWDISYIAAIASAISCLSYMAVGLDIAAVANSKDVSNMDPLLEVLLNILNASAWVYFGYLSKPVDNFIGVPNVIGVVLLAVELGFYFKHRGAEPEPEAIQIVANIEEDFGPDLVLLFATPSPHAADVPDPEAEDVPDLEIEVVIA